MNRIYVACLALVIIVALSFFDAQVAQTQSQSSSILQPVRESAIQDYINLPISFIENQGQVDANVSYYVKGQGQTVLLKRDGIVFDLTNNNADRLVFSLNFMNANKSPNVTYVDKYIGVINYLIGEDPAKWKINLPTYKEVIYHDIYPNIDLRLYGDSGFLRYDFVVKTGASVNDITLAYGGINTLNIDDGELVATTAFGDSRQEKPYLYQQIDNQKVQIEGRFKLLGDNTYGFEAEDYDSSYALIIDPVIAYSTYLGGSEDDSANSVVFGGPSGHVYIGGTTTSTDFPVRNGYLGSYQGGTRDAFVAEIDTASSGAPSLVYCTYIGGNGDDVINGIEVTPSGNVYLSGSTTSTNFPVKNGYLVTPGGGKDVFLTRLLAGGTNLAYSTYLGGSGDDSGNGLTVDASTGIAYITGSSTSTNFPLKNAFQTTPGGQQDAFVAGINPALTGIASLIYSSYLGGSGTDIANSITMLSADWGVVVYIGGETTSADFPTKGDPHPMQDQFWGTQDGFVAAFIPASSGATSLYFSSFLGGAGENSVTAVGICDTGCLYAIGWTDNDAFPMMVAPYQSYQGGIDAFFVRIAPSGYQQYFSTYFGGAGDDYPDNVYSDYKTGTAVITGYTTSLNFPVKNATRSTLGGQKDAFVVRVNPFVMPDPDNPLHPYANFMLFASYLGGSGNDIGRGITVDNHGGVLIAGETTSSNFPTQNPYQASLQGGARDTFITGIGEVFASVTTGDATGITATSARLNGNLTAQGTGWGADVTRVSFEWGTSPGVYSHNTAPQEIPSPTLGPFYSDITGLSTGATYYFRAKVDGDGITYGVENTFAATSSSSITVNLSVVLQGGSRPDAGWIIPLTVKFFTPGANVLTATPVYQFVPTTSRLDTTAVAQATGIIAGNYDITAVSEHTLVNVRRNVAIASSGTNLNMGALLEGNANDDNIINIQDFGILAGSYGKSSVYAGYDPRADFDKSGQVNIIDFGLLAANYGKTAPVIVP
ncbi:MAG: SBBP repeat-containing protein [Dehalococcoidales bacterium]|nr:SBBP repeat-containing protein [Dehalococcoidales bacterium]